MLAYAIHILANISPSKWLTLILLLLLCNLIYSCDVHGKGFPTSSTYYLNVAVGSSLAFILWSTLCLRTPGTEYLANFVPLWSWYQGFTLGNDEVRWQIFFNILLFMPLGVSLCLSKPRPMGHILLRGFILSLFIEVCQFTFCLGMFEWDDLVHNSLGCVLGAFFAKPLKR